MTAITFEVHVQPVLFLDCGDCNGQGTVASYAWTRWIRECAAARADFEAVYPDEDWYRSPEHGELDAEQPEEPYDLDCLSCGGRGRRFTDAGRSLLRSLREQQGQVIA